MIDMDLNSLTIFAKVAEVGSFSEASRRLSMPIATVSRRVAELEDQLGVRLLHRSTRSLRITDVGSEILEHARRAVDVRNAISGIVSNHRSGVSYVLRLCAPPNINSLVTALVCAFRASYPEVRVHVDVSLDVTEPMKEGVDLAFRFGPLETATLVAHRVLTYRHRLVASAAYVAQHVPPQEPVDLLNHRLIAFSHCSGWKNWDFVNTDGVQEQTLKFSPHLSMNDFVCLTAALLSGAGIGDLPPLAQPELVQEGKLVEVMPRWRFPERNLLLLHPARRQVPRQVAMFRAFVEQMAPAIFPPLPA
jgi:DNA-binding transcriptional LysR family regulator